jgi:hypothetical protein
MPTIWLSLNLDLLVLLDEAVVDEDTNDDRRYVHSEVHHEVHQPKRTQANHIHLQAAWESNPLRVLILKDLRHFRILPILEILSYAVLNPQIAPSGFRS